MDDFLNNGENNQLPPQGLVPTEGEAPRAEEAAVSHESIDSFLESVITPQDAPAPFASLFGAPDAEEPQSTRAADGFAPQSEPMQEPAYQEPMAAAQPVETVWNVPQYTTSFNQPAPPASVYPAYPEFKKRKKKRWPMVVAIVLAVIVVAGVVSLAGYGGYQMVKNVLPGNSSSSNSGAASDVPGIALEPPLAEGALTSRSIVEKVRPSVVGIICYTNDSYSPASEGSGIIMNKDGYIITNAHVIDGANMVNVVLSTDEEFTATVIGSDTRSDIAVLKINAGKDLPYAAFGDSSQVQIGDRVLAMGNPGGIQFFGSVTQGIISNINLEAVISVKCFVTDAAINPGNSGGALVNDFGQVIGITSAKIVADGYEGMGFAIPTNEAQPIIDQLLKYGKVTGRAIIGISVQAMDAYSAQMSGVPAGLIIVDITPGTDAAKKLQVRDIITKVNGTTVTDTSQLYTILDKLKPGDSVDITVFRRTATTTGGGFKDDYVNVSVTLGSDNG